MLTRLAALGCCLLSDLTLSQFVCAKEAETREAPKDTKAKGEEEW
jgi:hypothetical protein